MSEEKSIKTTENTQNTAETPAENTNIQSSGSLKHRGRASQIFIYLGKLFRMFIFQNDWKVLPMSAVISGLVAMVVGANLFKTQEGTLIGSFALACICIWNGFFNSIQVICRERPIVKREHRSGMHISSYVAAHMIYQAFLCLGQTVITIIVCHLMKVTFPDKDLFGMTPIVEIGITLFLITYCADMMALMVSAFVHSTTTAMTIMPFLLIFQLVFSGSFFQLDGDMLNKIKETTISKWGLTALCSQGDYNAKPMVSLWNAVAKFQNVDMGDYLVNASENLNLDDKDGLNLKLTNENGEFKPISDFMQYAQQSGAKDQILDWSGKNNQNSAYAFSEEAVLNCWEHLILFIVAYALIAVICLEFIDRDKR